MEKKKIIKITTINQTIPSSTKNMNEVIVTTKPHPKTSISSESKHIPLFFKQNDKTKTSMKHKIPIHKDIAKKNDLIHDDSDHYFHHPHFSKKKDHKSIQYQETNHHTNHSHHQKKTPISNELKQSVNVNGKLSILPSKTSTRLLSNTTTTEKGDKSTKDILSSSSSLTSKSSVSDTSSVDTIHINSNGNDTKKDQVVISKYALEDAFGFIHDVDCLDHFSIAKKFKTVSEKLNSEDKKQVQHFIISKKHIFDDHQMEDVYKMCLDQYFK